MNWINKLNIRVKLLVVILSVVGGLIALGFAYTYRLLQSGQKARDFSDSEQQMHEILATEKWFQDNSLNISALLSLDSLVQTALLNSSETNQFEIALTKKLHLFKGIVLNQANFKIDIGLYLPSGKLIHSTNADYTKNPDFSINKSTSSEVFYGYKMTYDGLKYVGSFPVFSSKNAFIGRVEISLIVEQLIQSFVLNENEELAVLVHNKELIKFNIKNTSNINRYNVLAKTGTEFNLNNLQKVLPKDYSSKNLKVIQEGYLTAVKPLQTIEGKHIGYLVFQKNTNSELAAIDNEFIKLLWFMLFFVIVVILIVRYLAIIMLTRPMNQMKRIIHEMALGKFPEIPVRKVQDEITDIYVSVSQLNGALQQASHFADDIRNSNFNTDYTKLSDEDDLGESLIKMRNQLYQSEQAKKTIEAEDKIKFWKTKAFAELGDSIRLHVNDIDGLSHEVLKSILSSLGASFGALYVLEGTELTPKAMIAGEKSKRLNQTLKLGEGLLGEAALDKEIIYLDKVPQDYNLVISGLGQALPNELVFVPIAKHGQVNGVMEIASLQRIEPYMLDFLRQASLSISSSIDEVLKNLETRQLLEQSQQQAEELSAQEEEMRQNLEELQATQEESSRRENELGFNLKSLENSLVTIDFSTEGTVLKANENALIQLGNIQNSNIVSRPFSQLFTSNTDVDLLTFYQIVGHLENQNYYQIDCVFSAASQPYDAQILCSKVEDEYGDTLKIKVIVLTLKEKTITRIETKTEFTDNPELKQRIDDLEIQLSIVNNQLNAQNHLVESVNKVKRNLNRI